MVHKEIFFCQKDTKTLSYYTNYMYNWYNTKIVINYD